MKIGIDVSTVLNFGIKVGSGRYIINLVDSLLSLEDNRVSQEIEKTTSRTRTNQKKVKDNNTFIFTGRYFNNENLHLFKELKDKYPKLDIKYRFFASSEEKIKKWDDRNFPPLEFKGFKSDILHCPDYLIPPTLNKNIILTIHDLSFFRFPQFNFDWFIKKYQKVTLENAKRAKIIIADSYSTKNDIMKFMGIEDSKIHVVYLAPDKKFRILDKNEINLSTLEKYGINKNFILSVGTIEPRKNFKTLIRAFDLFKEKNKIAKTYKLVIVGKTGWKSEETFEAYNNSKNKKDIIFTGEIPDDDLLQLYNCASLFVYPTIFEGFGLPILEAMACGIPVIASNTSSIPEILNHDNLLFNPFDENEISRKINNILSTPHLREEIRDLCIKEVSKFSWQKTALDTFRVYNLCFNK